MSEPGDHDGTDPNIAMPSGPPTEEIELPPASEDEVEEVEEQAGAPTPSAPPPPPPLPGRMPSRPPFDKPFPTSTARAPSSRPAPFPSRTATSTRLATPAAKPASSTPPAASSPTPLRRTQERAQERPPERQRLAQMQTQLDEARSALARQRHELDELRGQLEAKEERLEALMSELRESGGREALEAKLRALDERGDAFAQELRMRVERAEQRGAEVSTFESRIRELEEGTELSRTRMRVERLGHQVKESLDRIERVEATQAEIAARLAKDDEKERRLARLASLFEELAEEVRAQRDASGLDELRARLEDVEALTLETGSGLRAQGAKIKELGESIVPPPRTPSTQPGLTAIKGIGPKYAKQLAAMGVTQVSQIAAWTDEDVERAAVQLGIKPERIHKAAWITKAKALEES